MAAGCGSMHALQTCRSTNLFRFGLHVGIILIRGESIPTLTRKKKKKGRSKKYSSHCKEKKFDIIRRGQRDNVLSF